MPTRLEPASCQSGFWSAPIGRLQSRDERVHHYLSLCLFNKLNHVCQYPYLESEGFKLEGSA